MSDLQMKSRHGAGQRFSDERIAAFQQGIRGRLATPGSEDYDQARTIWNAMIDRRPALVVRCAGAADVLRSVRFARDNDLLVGVRGGGHNIAGNAVCDGGLQIDLSLMKSVRVDPVARTARVEPGVTLGEFDREAQAFGLATPLGINSTTGVAGLTLGGGFGWLSRGLGLSIDNLLSADVVTADGELLRASEQENPDLFWGIRGGGGNFGVVTSFEFKLHPVGPELLAGLIVHPLDDAREVMRFHREFMATVPDELTCWFVMRQAPPLPFLPPEWHGKEILALAVCYNGDIAEGERIARPLREFGRPIADVIGPTPYAGWQTVLDPLLAPGARNYWKSHDFADTSDGLIEVMMDHARRIPDPQTEIACAQLGGAVSRVPRGATAYNHRDGQYVMNVHGRWSDPAKDEACIAWARSLWQAAAPFATGSVYVNFLTQEEGGRVREAYGENYDRLVALKNKYDPANLFGVNQNISPTV
ncbi:FAD-binding oxidoreductase [Ramlibacter sp. WS9]|uniref:FAD-binding oxidoreductase n=1 Tax=Ramlibacter sp. WS9 TaxID=1882741 RepID=UPI0011435692|nr:FAD-binding oxidoreductase [Ramlibacter sp. WS9]ROZ69447.1 FAD-binding oxidoreductase [Ramlibacter sp. WS9]